MDSSRQRPLFLVLIALTALVVCGAAAAAWLGATPEPGGEPSEASPDPSEVIAEAEAFYASRPAYERPRPYSEVPEGLGNMRAETCGGCHQQIYREWQLSTHRRAWLDDAQFQAELTKSRGAHDPNAGDVGWLCVNCHTPNVQQLDRLVVGLKDDQIHQPVYVDNPTFDEAMQQEAITCATCHVRDGVVYGPWGDTEAPHPTAKGEFLLDEQICVSCHQAEARYPARNLGCFFSTGVEWSQSRWAEQGVSCQSCHMPQIERKVAEHFDVPPRKTRRHWFGGSLIPKNPAFAEEIAALEPIYGSGVTLEVLAAPEGLEPAPLREPPIESAPEVLGCVGKTPCRRVLVRVRNDRAGHYMPSGDPERHLEIVAEATDASGQVLGRAYDLIGSRYKWWPTIELLEDTRIPPGEHRDLWVEAPGQGPFSLEVRARKQRMYPEAFEHHELAGEYVRGRRFHLSRWQVDGQGRPALEHIEDDFGTRDELTPPEGKLDPTSP